MIRLRRISRIIWLVVVMCVYNTEYRASLHSAAAETQLAFPARLLLDFDPVGRQYLI
jgi:hypothetical protein